MGIGKHQSSRLAFTMVEVMIVVVLIGILSSLVIPRFLASQGLREAEATSITLAQDLEWARLQTVATQQRHYVVFDSAARGWSVYKEATGDLTCTPASETLVRSHAMGTAVVFGFSTNFSSLPGALSATTGFASTSVPRSGRGAGIATTDDCLEGATSGSGSWSSTVTACVSRGVPDLETGVVYLSSTRSKAKAFAILYNDNGASASLQIQRWTWQGSWGRS